MFRTDVINLDSIQKTDEGFLISDARVTRAGVFQYKNDDGSDRFEFRSPDEVFKGVSLDTLKRKPITNNHPARGFVIPENAKTLSVGFTGENIKRDGNFVRIPVTVTDGTAITDIEAGKRELSCGYHCDVEPCSGEFEGQKYTHVQRNIRYNHVAIVNKGRAGSDVRIDLDSDEDMIDPIEVRRDMRGSDLKSDTESSRTGMDVLTDDSFDPMEELFGKS